MPSSIAHHRCSGRMRSRVSGTPMSLLRLPLVASTAASPAWQRKIAASISFTVVLPFEPAIATRAGEKRARQCRARRLLVGKRQALSGDLLVALMALACDEHHVFAGSGCDGELDSAPPIGLGYAGALHAGDDRCDDGARVLAAWVVGSDEHPVGESLGHGAHHRAFG